MLKTRNISSVATSPWSCRKWNTSGIFQVPNLISAGLFGDGAAAVVLVGAERAARMDLRGPTVRETRSVFYPDTEDLMGWRIDEHGFNIQLSTAVPAVARERVGQDVDEFLHAHDLERADIATWVAHPGGPKVLAGLRDGLGLSDEDLSLSWDSLRRMGNLSSASVLMILRATMDQRRPRPGAYGVMLAMGPGFCSELLLLRW